MEILRFIAWCWAGTDIYARLLIALISWVAISGIATYMLSLGLGPAIALFFAGLGVVGVIFICSLIYKAILAAWRRYKREKEIEADEIVRRLRGV